jgi:hypothetical protein
MSVFRTRFARITSKDYTTDPIVELATKCGENDELRVILSCSAKPFAEVEPGCSFGHVPELSR